MTTVVDTVNVDDCLASVEQIIRGAPRTTLRRAFMRSARSFCRQTQCVRVTVDGSTANGDVLYALSNNENLDVVGVFAVSVKQGGSVRPLAPSDSSTWDPNAGRGVPVQFQFVPVARVALYPTPDASYPLHITVIAAPRETAKVIPTEVMSKWSGAIEAGALAYLHTIPGTTFYSAAEAVRQQKIFQSDVNNCKADVARAFNPGSVRVQPRRFGAGFGR